MATQARVALRPNNEAPHPTFAVERGTGCLLAGDITIPITLDLRLQRLRLLGIIGQRANLLADLAWNGGAE